MPDKNLLIRSISGGFYALILSLALLEGLQWSLLLFLLFAFFASFELFKTEYHHRLCALADGFLFALIAASFYLRKSGYADSLSPWLPYVAGVAVAIMVTRRKLSGASTWSIFRSLVGLAYLYIGLGLLLRCGGPLNAPEIFRGEAVLFVFILLWSSDTFAYLTGRKWGKYKLAPAISPGKTIEGLLGGLLITLMIAPFAGAFFCGYPWFLSVVLALVVVISGTLGDLTESAWKRFHGIKDSGKMLPGHGGYLDRLDSAFLAGPCVYFMLHFWPL